MQKKFKAAITREGSALGWKIVDVPFDVKSTFGSGGRVPVRGTVNGAPFRTSLFPRKGAAHFLMLNKKLQQAAGASELGELVEVVIELDTEKRTVATPKLLRDALSEEEGLLEYFNALSYSYRKWMSESVTSPKSAQVRKHHAEQLAVQLYEMRAGELEPPPILLAAFARNPKAKKGWDLMPTSQRRGHLWGIFYYKTPETRDRRIEKALQAMVALAEKKRSK